MLGQIWQQVFTGPLLATLLWLSDWTGNLGVAIVLLTVIIQLILTPLRLPSLRSARKMRELKPHLDNLKSKHGDDRTALAQAQMELYKEHNLNPLGGILPTLLSIPVIIALYQVLLNTLHTVEGLNTGFLWLDIARPDPIYLLPLLVAAAQFVMSSQLATSGSTPNQNQPATTETAAKPDDMAQVMQSQMKFIFPVMSGVITATLPAGVGLYWLASVLFSIIQYQAVELMARREVLK